MWQSTFGDRLWCGLLFATAGLLAAGCEPDLGPCLMPDGGPEAQDVPHAGQVLVNSRCAGGRCHSVDATGELREGAPGDLNFDLVPSDMSPAQIAKVRDGAENVNDHRHSMWGEIDDGSMPPGPPAGTGELSSNDKETIRNWLACGAEVIAAPAKNGPIGTSWTDIYEALVGPGSTLCMNCHGATTSASGGGFMLGNPGDACAAYNRVVNVPAKTTIGVPPCAGKGDLVEPNNPDASILLRKIEGGMQICGAPMPLGNPNGLGASNPIVVQMRMWIMQGAPKPTNCP